VNQLTNAGKLATRSRTPHGVPALVGAAGDRAAVRFLEFFAADIRGPHRRRSYSRAVVRLLRPVRRRQVHLLRSRPIAPDGTVRGAGRRS